MFKKECKYVKKKNEMSIAQICSNHIKMIFFIQMSLNNIDDELTQWDSEQNRNL